MGDGSLTQEEIDRLLQGADNFSSEAVQTKAADEKTEEILSPLERDLVSDSVHQAWKGGGLALGQILKRKVRLGNPFGDVVSQQALESETAPGYVCLTVTVSGGLTGKIALFLDADSAGKITEIVMGGNGNGGGSRSLDSAEIATIKDTLGPFHTRGITSLGNRLAQPVSGSSPEVKTTGGATYPFSVGSHYLRIQFPFAIEGVLDSRILVVVPVELAGQILRSVRSGGSGGGSGMAAGGDFGLAGGDFNEDFHEGPRADIKEVNFPSFSLGHQGPGEPNLHLLMDVQMTLTVELGRTRMYIKEILGLGEGSIIELDKLAGEPVDLLVNGKLIAKGEVVVIDENFGVRVTDIVSPVDRIKASRKI